MFLILSLISPIQVNILPVNQKPLIGHRITMIFTNMKSYKFAPAGVIRGGRGISGT